jgi:hypothetical protein
MKCGKVILISMSQNCMASFSKFSDQQAADDYINNVANSMKDGMESPEIHSFDNPALGLPKGY